jgi:hypothetical protein
MIHGLVVLGAVFVARHRTVFTRPAASLKHVQGTGTASETAAFMSDPSPIPLPQGGEKVGSGGLRVETLEFRSEETGDGARAGAGCARAAVASLGIRVVIGVGVHVVDE